MLQEKRQNQSARREGKNSKLEEWWEELVQQQKEWLDHEMTRITTGMPIVKCDPLQKNRPFAKIIQNALEARTVTGAEKGLLD